MRRGGAKRRRDANEGAITAALEAAGAQVFYLTGSGLPDLLIAFRGACYAVEVKTATGKLRPSQKNQPWPIVRTPEEALAVIGATT